MLITLVFLMKNKFSKSIVCHQKDGTNTFLSTLEDNTLETTFIIIIYSAAFFISINMMHI